MFYYFFMMLMMFSMFSFFLLLYLLYSDLIVFFDWFFFDMNSTYFSLFFLFDWMSLLFMSFVLFISSMVTYYSKEYMKNDYNKIRFINLVFMFIISMMFLIMCPNLISILIGWDGLGLVSYCLVIYFQNYKSYNAGLLTSLTNRIGDVAFLISIAIMLNMGSWNFYIFMDFIIMNKVFMLMIMLAAMTKSAQIPFSSWLPAAMAAPTPVSALVHSSTLVTAGVYLMIRFYSFFYLFKYFMFFLLLIGCLTMFMSGLGANFEMDFKKIIALSTLSQLGLMMGILSLGFEKLAFFHLLSHALFKSLLFLCAGIFIHSMMNFQDIRFSGGLNLFLTCINFVISSLALCGMPFLAGYYSKDLILEFVLMNNINIMIFFIFFISTMFTVIYSFRLIYFIFMNFMGFILVDIHENMFMIYPMFMLSIFSVMGGSLLMWLMFPFFNLVILSMMMKLLTLSICSFGFIISLIINLEKIKNFKYNMLIFKYFVYLMWFMPIIFCYYINKYYIMFFNKYKLYGDMGWMEFYGGNIFKMIGQFINFMSFLNLFKYYFMLVFMFFIMLLFI